MISKSKTVFRPTNWPYSDLRIIIAQSKKEQILALKTVNERVDVHNSLEDDAVEKDVAYLAKNFRKFLKFKNSGKFGDKGKESQSTQDVTCFECNGHGHFKK